MTARVDEILGELINIKTDFASMTDIGDTCYICGFPFDKEFRLKAIAEVKERLRALIEGLRVEIPEINLNDIAQKLHERSKAIGRNKTLDDVLKLFE